MKTKEYYENLAESIRTTLAQAKDKIQSQDKWSEGAKVDATREAQEAAKDKMQQLRQEFRNEKLQRLEYCKTKLFAEPNQSNQMNFRAAIDRASLVAGSPTDLKKLLDQAIQTGDTTLQRAICFQSFQSEFFDLMEDSAPENDKKYAVEIDELTGYFKGLENGHPTQTSMFESMTFQV